jgi:tight adherence protein C
MNDLGLALSGFSRGAILLLVFVGVAVSAFLLASGLAYRRSVKQRLATSGTHDPAAGQSLRSIGAETAWLQLVKAIESRGLSLADSSTVLRDRMIAAGYSHPEAPRLFTLIRMVMTIGLPTAYVAFSYSTGNAPSLLKLYFIGAGLGLAGLYFPNLWVAARAARRQREMLNGFPDALDLMLVCVEAGLGLEAAFNRVGSEMTRSHPLIADLLGGLSLELRAGRSREQALRRMADRTGLEEFRSFATLLIQSDRLGASIGQALRVYASEMRERRRMRAEEKAHRLPVLLSIPLVACMLPTMIGVLMLPAVIRVLRQIVPAMSGGG